jgi:hypothetical protein
MRRRLPKLLLTLVLSALAIIPSTPRPAVGNDHTVLAKLPNEVKLRKLHLVRPDLIPYPLFFEIYC